LDPKGKKEGRALRGGIKGLIWGNQTGQNGGIGGPKPNCLEFHGLGKGGLGTLGRVWGETFLELFEGKGFKGFKKELGFKR